MKALDRMRAAAAKFIRTRRAAFNAKDLGQNLLEYVGLVILVAGVVAAIMGTGVLKELRTQFESAVTSVTNGGGGNGGGNGGGGQGNGGD